MQRQTGNDWGIMGHSECLQQSLKEMMSLYAVIIGQMSQVH